MSEEVGRSIMIIIAIAVVAILGFFVYSLVSGATSRPVLTPAGDGYVFSDNSIRFWVRNIGRATADLSGATVTFPAFGVTVSVTCTPTLLNPEVTAECTGTVANPPPGWAGNNTFSGILVTKYGSYNIVLRRG